MAIATPIRSTSPQSTHTGRVLFAISQDEWNLFFPNGVAIPNAEVISYDDAFGTFKGALENYRPEVLVASWSTPLIEREWLNNLPFLRYVCYTSGSVRKLVPREFLERGGIVTNWGTLAAKNVAEHALLLILAGLRRIGEWPPVIEGKLQWQPSLIVTKTLFGKRVGIHGFGNVGQALCGLLRPFGVSVSAFTWGVSDEIYTKCGAHRAGSIDELFENSDILVECEALTPHTQGMINRTLLQRLRPETLFVNVGRGAVTDEDALAELAQSGHLRLALDVYATDPIAPSSPLHKVDGVVLSPHIAGPTSDQFVRCGELAKRNLTAYFCSMPLEATLSLEMYDRAT